MKAIHPIAGAVALLCVITFWLATIISELSGSSALVVAVKSAIPWGFLLLIPALAATGASGFKQAQGGRDGGRDDLIDGKRGRMPFIAGNGLLILIPSALFLAGRARSGVFDCAFYLVQGLELLAGATNITLLALNMRDGLRLSGRLPGPSREETAP